MNRNWLGGPKMTEHDKATYNGLILIILIGLTVLFWGYEKLVLKNCRKPIQWITAVLC